MGAAAMRLGRRVRSVIAAALLGLTGCDGMSGNATSAAANGGAEAGQKLEAYIGAYNDLFGTTGLEGAAESYRLSNVPHGTPAGDFRVDPGWIAKTVEKLKTARALPGGSSEVDAAADALIASASKAEAHLARLSTYYRGRKYLDDKFARGKAENAAMLGELDAAERDMRAFGTLLDGAIDQRDAALIEQLKSGDQVVYNVKLGLMHAKKLLAVFSGEKKPSDPALIAKAEGEVAIIEKAIADGEAAARKQGKEQPRSLNMLTQMLGFYREFKADRDPSHIETMTTCYNGAISYANE